MTFDAFYAFLTEHPLFIPELLGVVALLVLAVVWVRVSHLKSSLRSATGAIATWSPDETSAREHDVCAFVRHYLAGPTTAQLPGWSAPRILVARNIDEILDAFVERRTAATRFILGPLATAVALICTFFLIAHVLEHDVGTAVAGAAGAESNSALSTAVRTLGAKFYISATGIGVSLIFAVVVPHSRSGLLHLAHDVARQVGDRFCTPTMLAAATQLELLREAQASRARETERDRRENDRDKREHDRDRREIEATQAQETRHKADSAALTLRLAEMGTTLSGIRADLDKLQSIEVSVKDLGAEVTSQIRHMLTNDLGEQIKEILHEVMSDASKLTDKLQQSILDGLEQTLQREIPRIIESLQAIQTSVEGQAASPVERILEQLQGVISGGFQGESAQMSSAIRQFSEVVPTLAKELRETAQNLTTDMRSRTDENVRATETLVSQVTGLLGRLESQQVATQELVENIGRAASSTAESLVRTVQTESSTMFGEMLRTSRQDIDEMLGRLREASSMSTGNYAALEASVNATSRAILESRDGLQAAATAVRQFAEQSREVLGEARTSHELATRASTAFQQSATTLREGVDSMREAVASARTQASEQGQLLEQHRRALVELQDLWPSLFDTYIRSFDDKSKQLLQGWDEFFKKTGAFSDTAGRGLADAAEELLSAVQQLSRLQEARRA